MEKNLKNGQPRSPGKAIKEYCFRECCTSQRKEVELCTCHDCPLYNFRDGKNPYRTKRVMTEEQRIASIERLSKAREEKNARNRI